VASDHAARFLAPLQFIVSPEMPKLEVGTAEVDTDQVRHERAA